MGSQHDIECTSCKRQGMAQSTGTGRTPQWRYFEHRYYHCKKCDGLSTAAVLRSDKDLKAAFEDAPKDWSETETGHMSHQAMAELLMDARRWPRCACGGRLSGSTREVESGPQPCPVCPGELALGPSIMEWS